MAAGIEIPRWTQVLALSGLAALLGLAAGLAPALAVTAALSLTLIGVALVNLTAGLVLFITLVFLEFVLPAVSGLSFTKAAGFLLLASWVAKLTFDADGRRNFFAAFPAASLLLAAFVAWCALSMFWAVSIGAALTDIQRYMLNFGLVVIMFSAIAKPRHAYLIFGAFLAGCALTSLYALVFKPTTELDPTRIVSTVGNPNILASILVAGFVIALAGVYAFQRTAWRLGSGLTAVLCLATLFPTGSRSGVIALAGALGVSVLVAGRWRWQVLIATAALAVSITVGFLSFAPQHLRDRITSAAQGQVSTDEGRTTLWQVGWQMAQDKPVNGFGVGNFASSSGPYAFEPGLAPQSQFVIDDPQVAHNIYLQILAEIGIVGLIGFLAIMAFSMRSALRAAHIYERLGERTLEILSRALIPAVTAILISDFFASEQFNKILWLLVGLGPAMLGVARSLDQEADSERRPEAA